MAEKAWNNKQAWKLYKENWQLAREIVRIRDGFVCQIPGCGKARDLQLDHVISRACKITFFDTDFLGYLCGPHHQHKSFRHGQWVDLTVREICIQRVGALRMADAIWESKKTCGGFRTVWYQEKINAELKKELEELQKVQMPETKATGG